MNTVSDKAFFENETLLLADATGEDISLCLTRKGKVISEKHSHGGALENFFSLFKALLAQASISFEEVNAVGFCRGPGSILGIRIVSAAFAALRAKNPNISIFIWDLLPVYSEILKSEGREVFSIICPSRKNFANVLHTEGESWVTEEIPSTQIAGLPQPRLLISQRKTDDSNFSGIEEIYFPAAKIFERLKTTPELAQVLCGNETADALTFSKREYTKWNSQAHS